MAVPFYLRGTRFTLHALKPKTRFLKSTAFRGISTFKFSDLKIIEAEPQEKKFKPDACGLLFGKHFSDHMFEVPWSASDGWGTPVIRPLYKFSLHPAAKVLHYAQETFEGLKAFRNTRGEISLFRPELHMRRFLESSRRADLPLFCVNELLMCIRKLVNLDKEWVPTEGKSSLYIRPVFIGTEPTLGVSSSNEALLYVITSPTGPYFNPELDSVALLAEPAYVRAWPGGVGNVKMGSNYGPTIYVQKEAERRGCHQVLWLFDDDHMLTEVGSMNIFAFFTDFKGKKTLVTPPLDGTILPGITRQTVLELARDWNEFRVQERHVTMYELLGSLSEDCLLEIFGTGTACKICPVSSIQYCGETFDIPTMKQEDPLFRRLLKEIEDIQYGGKPHNWVVPIGF